MSLQCVGFYFQMISSLQTEIVSKHVEKRTKKMRVRTLSPFSFLVLAEPGKPTKVVHFDMDQETGVVRIDCSEWETGVSCKANAYSMLCSHVNAAIKRLLANAKRKHLLNDEEKRSKGIRQYARRVMKESKQPELKGVQL